MAIGDQNQGSDVGGRLDRYLERKNAWRSMNGSFPMSADMEATLSGLAAAVTPAQEDLQGMVRASMAAYCDGTQTMEEIWREKVAEGADTVRVVDGVFGFYRGEEQLVVKTRPMTISVLPEILEMREDEREWVIGTARAEAGVGSVDWGGRQQGEERIPDFEFQSPDGGSLLVAGAGTDAVAPPSSGPVQSNI